MKLNDMLKSAPEKYAGAPEISKTKWKELEPLTVSQILEKSKKFVSENNGMFDIESDEIEFK